MKATQFVKDHGIEQAENLLTLLKNLGCPDDMKFTVINGMWHRSSDGFTYDELDQIIKSHELVEKLGGISEAIEYTGSQYISPVEWQKVNDAIKLVEACQ